MDNEIETIYYLENPEKNIITFATGTQVKYDDIIKDVFGVACLKDLPMMIKYNKSFQDCVRNRRGLRNQDITLDMVFHVASRQELLQLRKKLIEKKGGNDDSQNPVIPCPFQTVIRLQEGIFKWDKKKCTYV